MIDEGVTYTPRLHRNPEILTEQAEEGRRRNVIQLPLRGHVDDAMEEPAPPPAGNTERIGRMDEDEVEPDALADRLADGVNQRAHDVSRAHGVRAVWQGHVDEPAVSPRGHGESAARQHDDRHLLL